MIFLRKQFFLSQASRKLPIDRSSVFSTPEARSGRFEPSELEQTSSASRSVACAPVGRLGRISCNTTRNPRCAACQAASEPAKPPPITTRSGFMVEFYHGRHPSLPKTRLAHILQLRKLSVNFSISLTSSFDFFAQHHAIEGIVLLRDFSLGLEREKFNR